MLGVVINLSCRVGHSPGWVRVTNLAAQCAPFSSETAVKVSQSATDVRESH